MNEHGADEEAASQSASEIVPHGELRSLSEGAWFAEGILDRDIFESLQELLDTDVLAETYRAFLSQTRERLSGPPAPADTEAIHALGHSVRGTAGMLGAAAVAECAGRLEGVSQTAYPGLLAEMGRACDALEIGLRAAQVRV